MHSVETFSAVNIVVAIGFAVAPYLAPSGYFFVAVVVGLGYAFALCFLAAIYPSEFRLFVRDKSINATDRVNIFHPLLIVSGSLSLPWLVAYLPFNLAYTSLAIMVGGLIVASLIWAALKHVDFLSAFCVALPLFAGAFCPANFMAASSIRTITGGIVSEALPTRRRNYGVLKINFGTEVRRVNVGYDDFLKIGLGDVICVEEMTGFFGVKVDRLSSCPDVQ
jgi:hypothetical protein